MASFRWPSNPGSGGKHVGIPLGLKKVREKVQEQFVDVGWKKYYNRELFPVFRDVLKQEAILSAKRKFRGGSGLLARSIVIGGGGLGPGKQSFRIVVEGEAATYARILNWGGIIRPKKAEHLTIPFGDNVDIYGGTGKSVIGSMRNIKKKEGFTIVRKNGPLTGKKIVYLKGDAIDRHGLTAYTPRGRRIEERIKPVFELVKYQIVKATHWADEAQEKAIGLFDEYSTRKIKEYFSWWR